MNFTKFVGQPRQVCQLTKSHYYGQGCEINWAQEQAIYIHIIQQCSSTRTEKYLVMSQLPTMDYYVRHIYISKFQALK